MQTKINQGELGKVCADAISELINASAKHPEWPDELTDSMDLDDVQYVLGACRTFNDAPTGRTAQSIFDEEQFEFFEAVMMGDGAAARTELVQAIAMLLRMYCHIPDYLKQARKESDPKPGTPEAFEHEYMCQPVKDSTRHVHTPDVFHGIYRGERYYSCKCGTGYCVSEDDNSMREIDQLPKEVSNAMPF